MDWLSIIKALLPLVPVPGVAEAGVLANIAAQLIKHIKAQSGKTTAQILEEAGITLDENDQMLLEDLAKGE